MAAPGVAVAAPGGPRLIAAIDTPSASTAAQLAASLAPHCGLLKLGLEFFSANGPDAVAALDPSRIFLDLKLHDIPATVAGAAGAVGRLGAAMLTVHAAGGRAMIAAAREAIERHAMGGRPRTRLLAVTVLTSLDAAALRETGIEASPAVLVERLGRLAIEAGADGLVCSPAEVEALRRSLGPSPVLVVPGVRPAGSTVDDQARIATPAQAIVAGASYLVIGRPITRAPDPAAAAAAIVREIEEALRSPSR